MIDNECGVSSRVFWILVHDKLDYCDKYKIGLIEEKGRFNNNIAPFTC